MRQEVAPAHHPAGSHVGLGFGDELAELATAQVDQDLGRFSWRGIHAPQYAGALRMSGSWRGSSRWSDACPLAEADSHAPADGAAAPCVSSNGNGDGFFDGVLAVGPMSQRPIGFQHQHKRFAQIPFGFGQRSALRVGAGDFFHIADVPFATSQIDSGKLADHRSSSITVFATLPVYVDRQRTVNREN